MLIQFILLFFATHFSQKDVVFFQSQELKGLELTSQEQEFVILDDQEHEIPILEYRDSSGLIYWYRRVLTPVCLTGECLLIDIGIYWDCTGDFFGLEVHGEHLTKTDHSIFSVKDYQHLMGILKNDWSVLREYEFTNLVEQQEGDGVDGISGATKTEIAMETVKDAVYTTYTIWHLAHLGEKEQLVELTANQLNEKNLILKALVTNKDSKYRYFILDLLSNGKLTSTPELDSLVLEGLRSFEDPKFKKLSYNALSKIGLNHQIQKSLISIYLIASIQDKIQILTAFERPIKLTPELHACFSNDLTIDNDWFLVKLKKVIEAKRQF
ncbi:hypothetical protein [Reichenbachiella sp. MALMAid0571]|uniref:hypothetical protein n=1 Tax=Reichenbachiella sp. MALMAid0571 TaxID=3143939 RepID=UPI0032DE5F42